MPVAPIFDWEQTDTLIFIQATIKGFKKEAIDVFISDLFLKVNAAPTYLLQLDLLHPIAVEKSSFHIDGQLVKIKLTKQDSQIWETLCIDAKTEAQILQKRRAESQVRAEKIYNMKLDTREQQKEAEKKRMLSEHWEIEKAQRSEIEAKVREERDREQRDLYRWEEQQQEVKRTPKTPSDIFSAPSIRQAETKVVSIDFSPMPTRLPIRSRGDEDYYRKSRYKPVRVEDSPMFWKERGDKLYHACNWRGAADAYSESIKRDGCFLTCISNRAACHLHLHDYQRAIEDCDLALSMVANTPASETTQDQYRQSLVKLYVRRGAAYCWKGDFNKGLDDYRLASVYRAAEFDSDVATDMEAITKYMKEHSLEEERKDPLSEKRTAASMAYLGGNFSKAQEMYEDLLKLDEFDYKSRSNLAAVLLQEGAFQRALEESNSLIEFCAEVANALNEPGIQSSGAVDSDDEEEPEDEYVARRNAAAKTVRERSGHVYLLLKSYVRAGAAYCGLRDYRSAYEMFEKALRITPYDDDLRDDANRILEKLKFETLVSATKNQ